MFLIRELTVNDYDALVALWKEAGLPFRPNGRDQRERIAREITGPCSIFLVACLIEDWNNDSRTVFEHLGYRYYPDVHYYTKRKDDEV